jgi:hypothetical protein
MSKISTHSPNLVQCLFSIGSCLALLALAALPSRSEPAPIGQKPNPNHTWILLQQQGKPSDRQMQFIKADSLLPVVDEAMFSRLSRVYWCLSTMEPKTRRSGCSEQGWSVRGTTSSIQANPQIADFIPQGWRIEKEVSGDLNEDGQADRVVQIVQIGNSWVRPRSLLVLKATSSGWEKIATAPKLLLCTGCAGMMGGPDGQHIRLKIDIDRVR